MFGLQRPPASTLFDVLCCAARVAQHHRCAHPVCRERQAQVARANAVPAPHRHRSRPLCALRDRLSRTVRSTRLYCTLYTTESELEVRVQHNTLGSQCEQSAVRSAVCACACSPYGVSEKRAAIDLGTVELSAMGEPSRIPTLYVAVSNESSIDTWLTFDAELFATRATRASVVRKCAAASPLATLRSALTLYSSRRVLRLSCTSTCCTGTWTALVGTRSSRPSCSRTPMCKRCSTCSRQSPPTPPTTSRLRRPTRTRRTRPQRQRLSAARTMRSHEQ